MRCEHWGHVTRLHQPEPTWVRLPVSGVITTTGECAQKAAATPVTKLVMPGPFWAMQTPGLAIS